MNFENINNTVIQKLKIMTQPELQQQVTKASDVVYQLAVWEGNSHNL